MFVQTGALPGLLLCLGLRSQRPRRGLGSGQLGDSESRKLWHHHLSFESEEGQMAPLLADKMKGFFLQPQDASP